MTGHDLTDDEVVALIQHHLAAIQHMGDADECSWKHAGWGMHALAHNRPWTDCLQYPFPWDESEESHQRNEWRLPRLGDRWERLAALRVAVGHERWDAAARQSEAGDYYSIFMDREGADAYRGAA
jgi:hypothetical protein